MRTYEADDGGNSTTDRAYDVIINSDGNIVITGEASGYSGSKEIPALILDPNGDTLVTMSYARGSTDEGYGIFQQADGSYILVGETYANSTDNVISIYFLDANLNSTLTRGISVCGNAEASRGRYIQKISGGYFVAGHSDCPSGDRDFYYAKVDNTVDSVLWDRMIGGSSTELLYNVVYTTDNNFVLAGVTDSYGQGGDDGYITKVNENGTVIWSNTYGGANDDQIYGIIETSDGGFLITGWTESYGAGNADVLLIKLDINGDISWSKTYGGTGNDLGSEAVQTADGGYIVAAASSSDGAGGYDIMLIKITSTGNIEWSKVYGANGDEYAFNTNSNTYNGFPDIALSSSDIIVSSGSNSWGTTDLFVLKTDSSGNTGLDCNQMDISLQMDTTSIAKTTAPLDIDTPMGLDMSLNVVEGSIPFDGLNEVEPFSIVTGSNNASFEQSNGSAYVIPIGGSSPYTYSWDDSLKQTTQQAFGLGAGDYIITVTDGSGCSIFDTVTVTENEDPTLGVFELNKLNSIAIYPNPFEHNVVVELGDDNYNIEIIDMLGRIQNEYLNCTGRKNIQRDNMNSGTYLFRIINSEGKYTIKKVVIK